MDQLFVNSTANIAEYMLENASYGKNVTAALFFNDAINLVRELVTYKEVEVEYLEIMVPDYGGYSKEYYVTLSNDNVLSVEQAYRNGIYLNTESDLLLIHEDASSRIIGDNARTKCMELCIANRSGWTSQCPHDCCRDCSNCKNDIH